MVNILLRQLINILLAIYLIIIKNNKEREWSPKILIADNAPEIENGFLQAFGPFTEKNWRINCWAHAIRNIDKHIDKHIKDKENRIKIRADILNIQVVFNDKLFQTATTLLRTKWLKLTKNESGTQVFLDYFRDNWVNKKNGWYEGFQLGIPSQSNAIESSHRHQIKSFGNIKQRSTCKRFINDTGKQLVEDWSLKYRDIFKNGNINSNKKIFKKKPVILREDWEKAWQWGNKKHDYCHAFNESNTYMCSDSIKLPKKVDCRRYLKDIELCSWTDFDTMFSELKLYQVIQFNDKSWEMSTCTCWYWLKYYRCSHILVLATIMPMKNNPTNTYVDMEEDIFKKMKLTANRTLGRPKKNKGALSHQPNELQEKTVVV